MRVLYVIKYWKLSNMFCSNAKLLSIVGNNLDIPYHHLIDIHQLWFYILNFSGLSVLIEHLVLSWYIWKTRNRRHFQNTSNSTFQVTIEWKAYVEANQLSHHTKYVQHFSISTLKNSSRAISDLIPICNFNNIFI